jgi:hypothetical protein
VQFLVLIIDILLGLKPETFLTAGDFWMCQGGLFFKPLMNNDTAFLINQQVVLPTFTFFFFFLEENNSCCDVGIFFFAAFEINIRFQICIVHC